MAVQTITGVFAQTPASSDKTAITGHLTNLMTDLDTACTNGRLSSNVRDQLHDEIVSFMQRVATNLKA